MAHHHLALKLLDSLERDAYDNDDGCTAKRKTAEVDVELAVEQRDESDHGQEQSADKSDPGEDLLDVGGCGSAGTDARNSAVVLLEVVCHLNRVVLNGRIEIREHENEYEVQSDIQPAV